MYSPAAAGEDLHAFRTAIEGMLSDDRLGLSQASLGDRSPPSPMSRLTPWTAEGPRGPFARGYASTSDLTVVASKLENGFCASAAASAPASADTHVNFGRAQSQGSQGGWDVPAATAAPAPGRFYLNNAAIHFDAHEVSMLQSLL